MYTVNISQHAESDLLEAVRFYYAAGPMSALRLRERFNYVVDYLKNTPAISPRIGSSDYRWMPVGSFVAVFKINEEEHMVSVMRLHYRSSNWKEGITRGEDRYL